MSRFNMKFSNNQGLNVKNIINFDDVNCKSFGATNYPLHIAFIKFSNIPNFTTFVKGNI